MFSSVFSFAFLDSSYTFECTVTIGRLFRESLCSLVDVACDTLISMYASMNLNNEMLDVFRAVARIKNHTRVGMSLAEVSGVNIAELRSIGMIFGERHQKVITVGQNTYNIG